MNQENIPASADRAEVLLQAVRNKIEEYEEEQIKTGGFFNVFSALGMDWDEVKHCQFLYELLNPTGSHQQRILFLQPFVEHVLKIKDFDLRDVEVKREKHIGHGELDLFISNRQELIVIEAKIRARVDNQQLWKYQKWAQKQHDKKYHLYCLTLEVSMQEESEKIDNRKIEYQSLSFATDVLNWVEHCVQLEKIQKIPKIQEVLKQYAALIKKITGQNPEGLQMKLKELLRQGDNLAVAEALAKAIPSLKAELELKFWKAVIEKINPTMKKLGFEYSPDEPDFNDPRAIPELEKLIEAERAKKSGVIEFSYFVGSYKNDTNRQLYIHIGNAGGDERIYFAFMLWDRQQEEFIECKKDEKFHPLLNTLERMGWEKKNSSLRYTYINYDFNLQL